jgi:ferredoxin-NADP reductase
MLLPWRTAKLINIENETPTTRRFWFEVPELTSLTFTPGQFVTLDLPIHEKPNKRWRSYSIASAPDGSNTFELIIVQLEQGAGTTYLFNEITVGTNLPFRGPQGHFTLHEPLDTDLFLICTGTGIAPFRSMVQDLLRNKREHRQVYLIFGCRKKEDLLYYNEMIQLQQQLTGFHYHPVLSRETWEGHSGYVHEVYLKIIRENRALGAPGTQYPATFYLCGWKNMIDEARIRLKEEGYEKQHIKLELYG